MLESVPTQPRCRRNFGRTHTLAGWIRSHNSQGSRRAGLLELQPQTPSEVQIRALVAQLGEIAIGTREADAGLKSELQMGLRLSYDPVHAEVVVELTPRVLTDVSEGRVRPSAHGVERMTPHHIVTGLLAEVPSDDTYPASNRATAPTSTASSTTSIAAPSVSPVTPPSQRRKPKPSSTKQLPAHAARIAASAALTRNAMATASPAASAARPCPPRVSELPCLNRHA